MFIDEVYQLVKYIADKEGRGYIPPAQFNIFAKACQMEFLSVRLGNIQQIGQSGTPPFGYKANRRINVDLRPFVYGPISIPVNSQGNFDYPYGFIWPDAYYKNDFSRITEVDEDEYAGIKRHRVHPPTEDYPVVIFRNPYGFIDPYSIGSFKMSFVKEPPVPVWGYSVVSGEPVFNPGASTDFAIGRLNFLDIAVLILEKVGMNLGKEMVLQYSQIKQQQGS